MADPSIKEMLTTCGDTAGRRVRTTPSQQAVDEHFTSSFQEGSGVDTSITRMSRRERVGAVLRDNRFAIGVELLLVSLLIVFDVPLRTIVIVLVGWLSLWLRGSGWRTIGLNRPVSWGRTILTGIGIAAVYQLFALKLLEPLLYRLTNTPLDISQFATVRGNLIVFVLLVAVSWTLAAFGEEMVYRAYLLNRMADLFGHTKGGWVIGVLLSSSLFAFAHLDQGISGVLENWLVGALLASVYLLTRRNLWLPVFVHGFADTIGFALIFLGLYP